MQLLTGDMVLPRQRMGAPLNQHSSPDTSLSSHAVSGISSFAFQGTNAHFLLKPSPPDSSPLSPTSNFFTPWALQNLPGTTKPPKHSTVPPIMWERHYLSVVPPSHSVLRRFTPFPTPPKTAAMTGRTGWVAIQAEITHPSVAWLMDHVVSELRTLLQRNAEARDGAALYVN